MRHRRPSFAAAFQPGGKPPAAPPCSQRPAVEAARPLPAEGGFAFATVRLRKRATARRSAPPQRSRTAHGCRPARPQPAAPGRNPAVNAGKSEGMEPALAGSEQSRPRPRLLAGAARRPCRTNEKLKLAVKFPVLWELGNHEARRPTINAGDKERTIRWGSATTAPCPRLSRALWQNG
jgi:hypothetical protein